jgi:phage FluMu protein Com
MPEELTVELLLRRESELRCLMCGKLLGRAWTETLHYHIHICEACRCVFMRMIRTEFVGCFP